MNNSKAKRIAFYGMMVALAFTFSYLESLIPFNFGIPGVKLGLANLVVVVALYVMKPGEAFTIALIRILLAGLTFGNAYSLAYSLCGGILSFIVMYFDQAFGNRSQHAWRYMPQYRSDCSGGSTYDR